MRTQQFSSPLTWEAIHGPQVRGPCTLCVRRTRKRSLRGVPLLVLGSALALGESPPETPPDG